MRKNLRWVSLDFLANYQGGNPRTYQLRLVSPDTSRPGTPLQVTQTSDQINVDTGAVAFQVNRRQFNGIESVSSDGVDPAATGILVQGGDGPYVVDAAGNLYQARYDTSPQVEGRGLRAWPSN